MIEREDLCIVIRKKCMRLPHWQALQTDFQLFCRRPLIAFRLQMHHMRKNAVFRNQVMRCALLAHGTVAIRPAKTRRTSAHPACNAASLACRFAKISPCIRRQAGKTMQSGLVNRHNMRIRFTDQRAEQFLLTVVITVNRPGC